jgi:hypothetical protein
MSMAMMSDVDMAVYPCLEVRRLPLIITSSRRRAIEEDQWCDSASSTDLFPEAAFPLSAPNLP